ncbi:hypothetical protein MXD62_31440 [Frankia sp. Mgl5]|nr:acyl-CoA dehydrogenase family protein [Frankia sp. Mgl5]MCK9931600.1 hypothetical protein [Frankia sp. Mgl5]
MTDACAQLHGGYGYIVKYPITRAWTDLRIYGGTAETLDRSLELG